MVGKMTSAFILQYEFYLSLRTTHAVFARTGGLLSRATKAETQGSMIPTKIPAFVRHTLFRVEDHFNKDLPVPGVQAQKSFRTE